MHGHQVKPDAFISSCVVTQGPMFYASRKASIKSAVAQWQSAWLETEGPQVQASQASLRCVLEQEHNSYLSTGSTRKTCPYITEILLIGCKESNQTNKSIKIVHFCKLPRAILVCVPAFHFSEAILAHRKNNILSLLHAHNIDADNLVNAHKLINTFDVQSLESQYASLWSQTDSPDHLPWR